ncbi:MAG: pyridoxal phosphate-dependent aminotransferase [Candidatus Eisenbacteria bacterium]
MTATDPIRVGLAPLELACAALEAVGATPHEVESLGWLQARAAVAALLSTHELEISPENITLTSSTSESYAHLFRLLANPGEAVLAPSPSYPLFEPLAHVEGLELRPYRLAFDGRWHLDRASLEQASSTAGARLIVVVEPNHPTGSCLGADDRAFIEALAERGDMAIVSDEVFRAFSRSPRVGPLPGWLGARRVPTFVLGGLSKLCGLPHLKLGWIAACGPEAEVREAMGGLEWLGDLFLSVGGPVQAALPALLLARERFQLQVRARIAANDAALAQLCQECPAITVLPAEGGWSAVLRLPATRTEEEWSLALMERGVLVHPGHFYDLTGGEHLVLSLIVEPQAFAEGCHRLGLLLDGL